MYSLQAYLWDDNESVVNWYNNQMNENGTVDADSFVGKNMTSLQKDAFFSQMKNSVIVSIYGLFAINGGAFFWNQKSPKKQFLENSEKLSKILKWAVRIFFHEILVLAWLVFPVQILVATKSQNWKSEEKWEV